MIGTVVVLAPAEYNAWRQGAGIGVASAGLSPVTRGRMVYVKYGCGLCHEDRAADRAPSLAGLNGSRVRLQGGAVVIADEQYLHDSILLAPKYVVPGYSSTMPTYAGIIGETEAADLVSYVESLRPEKAPLAINP
jgi:cytochrome c oxidase subunit 2